MQLRSTTLCAGAVLVLAMVANVRGEEAKIELHPWEKQIVDLTNAERARHGLPALQVDQNLMNMSRRHNGWMANTGYFSHSGMPVSENIALGQASPGSAVNTWMNSSGHRANILKNGIHRIGVSAFRSRSGAVYFTQQFSR